MRESITPTAIGPGEAAVYMGRMDIVSPGPARPCARESHSLGHRMGHGCLAHPRHAAEPIAEKGDGSALAVLTSATNSSALRDDRPGAAAGIAKPLVGEPDELHSDLIVPSPGSVLCCVALRCCDGSSRAPFHSKPFHVSAVIRGGCHIMCMLR